MAVREFYEALHREDLAKELQSKRAEINQKGFLWRLYDCIGRFKKDCDLALDIGRGTGSNLILLKEMINLRNGICLDISSQAGRSHFGLDKVVGSAQDLPFASDCADLIMLVEVLEHVVDPDRTLKDLVRCLRQDGIVVISTPNLASLWNRVLLMPGYQPLFTEVSTKAIFGRPGKEVVGHLRLFTMKALVEFLTFSGLEILELRAVSISKNGLSHFIENIAIKLRKGLGSRLIVVARRRC